MAAQASRKHRLTAWATGLSLVLHGLILTGMVIGLKVLKPPPEEQALELRLVRPFEPQAPPEPPVPQASRRTAAAPSGPARVRPPPSPPQPPAAQPEAAPSPAPVAKAQAGPPDVRKPSVSGRMGCDDVLERRMTEEQRQACVNDLARLAREAKPLDLNIPDRKKAEYDRVARCQEARRRSAVPSLGQIDPGSVPAPGAVSNINPAYNTNTGLDARDQCSPG